MEQAKAVFKHENWFIFSVAIGMGERMTVAADQPATALKAFADACERLELLHGYFEDDTELRITVKPMTEQEVEKAKVCTDYDGPAEIVPLKRLFLEQLNKQEGQAYFVISMTLP